MTKEDYAENEAELLSKKEQRQIEKTIEAASAVFKSLK